MNLRNPLNQSLTALCGVVLLFTQASCRKHDRKQAPLRSLQVEVAPELLENRIGGIPGPLYQAYAGSPIHWQPWDADSFARAKAAKRIVVCVVGSTEQPDSFQSIRALESGARSVELLNQQYVPVLVDAEVCREAGRLSRILSEEIDQPMTYPFMVWMSYEGNPIGWTPVSNTVAGGIVGVFLQSHSMVHPIMQEDLERWRIEGREEYLLRNSAIDDRARRQRLLDKQQKEYPRNQEVDLVSCIRQLCSLYDDFSQTFDGTGNVLPVGVAELLATASMKPGLPPELRERCLFVARHLVDDWITSPMFDPLDDGVFLTNQHGSFDLPSFSRSAVGQARMLECLLLVHWVTGDRRILDAATRLRTHLEKENLVADGLFREMVHGDTDPLKWTWTIDEVNEVLGKEDGEWWASITGMKSFGNISPEVDQGRRFFRRNSLALGKSIEEMAASTRVPVATFTKRFEEAKGKLLQRRHQRMIEPAIDPLGYAGASFAMVSAYARSYSVTGSEAFRERAKELFTACRKAFDQNGVLYAYASGQSQPANESRAMLHALAMQAGIDVHHITGDDEAMAWADSIGQRMTRLFYRDGLIEECANDARVVDLPIVDLPMGSAESTYGQLAIAAASMNAHGRPMDPEIEEALRQVPANIAKSPAASWDLLAGWFAREFPLVLRTREADQAAALKVLSRLPMRGVLVKTVESADSQSRDTVEVRTPDGVSHKIKSPEALRNLLLPSAGK